MKHLLVVEDEQEFSPIVSSYIGNLHYKVAGIVGLGERAPALVSVRGPQGLGPVMRDNTEHFRRQDWGLPACPE